MPSAPLRFLPRPVGAAAGGANLVLLLLVVVVVEEEEEAAVGLLLLPRGEGVCECVGEFVLYIPLDDTRSCANKYADDKR